MSDTHPMLLPIALALLAGAVLALASLVAGWWGDLVALALPVVLAASAAVALVLLATTARWAVVPIATMLVAGALVFAPRWPLRTAAPVQPVRIAAANLLFDSDDPDGGVDSVVATGADVVVISELTARTDELLSARYLYRAVTDDLLSSRMFAQGVYARVPLTQLERPEGVTNQLVRVRVEAAQPFVLEAVHLPRPTFESPAPRGMIGWPGHRAAVFALDRIADAEAEPVVITGDLNLSDRASGYRRLVAGRLDVARTGWASTTYVGSLTWRSLLLRIDHLLVPSGWCASGAHTFTIAGSDHLGLVADVGACPP